MYLCMTAWASMQRVLHFADNAKHTQQTARFVQLKHWFAATTVTVGITPTSLRTVATASTS